jgi:hypothetical protein
MEQTLTTLFEHLALGDEIKIPIKLDQKNISGKFLVSDRDQGGVLTATLKEIHVDATLIINLANLEASRLEVPKDGFRLTVAAAVALKPFLAGTAPTFAASDVAVANISELRIGKTSTGLATATVDALVLGQPIIRIGEGAKQAISTLQLAANGSAVLLHDFSDGSTNLAKANFHAGGVEFKLLASPAQPNPTIDLNGTLVTNPVVRLDQIDLMVDTIGPAQAQSGKLIGLKVDATRVEKNKDPKHPTEITYAASPARFIKAESIEAAKVSIAKVLTIEGLRIKGFDMGLKDAEADFAGAVFLRQATLNLSATEIVRISVGDESLASLNNAHFDLSGTISASGDFTINGAPRVDLNITVSGVEHMLTGTGTAHLDPLTGSARSNMEIKFNCRDSGHLDVPIEYNFAIGGIALDAKMSNGVFSAEAATGPIALAVHNVGEAACNDPSNKWVIAPATHGWTYGVCACCFPPKVYRCEWHWDTPEINFVYHIRLRVTALLATAVLTGPRVRLEKGSINVCNVGAVALPTPPIVAGGYSPEIETNYPGADNIINAVIAAHTLPAQTLFANGLIAPVAWLVPAAGLIANVFCMR